MQSGRNTVKIYDLWQRAQEGVWRFLGQYENKTAIKLHGPWLWSMERHGGPPTQLTLLLHLREQERARDTSTDSETITVKSFSLSGHSLHLRTPRPFSPNIQGHSGGQKPPQITLFSFLFTQPSSFLWFLYKSLQHNFMAGITVSTVKQMVVI